MVDGIEIDKDIAEETLLPDDLNSLAVGSYVVPDPKKEKTVSLCCTRSCAIKFYNIP
jgi:hypothetical protein